jgi:ABC-2 type transport system permease protein
MIKPRIFAIIQKEFIHIIRDSRSLAIVFLMPVMMIGLYGYAITFDIKHIQLGVLDQERTPASRRLIQRLASTDYFTITTELQSRAEIEPAFLDRKMVAVVVIPNHFTSDRIENTETPVQLIVDGANANSATVVMNYLKSFFLTYSLDEMPAGFRLPLQIQPRVWYNPDLLSTHFIVPGLLAIIMMMICALLTSLTIARERETGTLEQILVSPIRPVEMIFGKVAPYVVLALLDATLIVMFSRIFFGVPMRGQPLLLLLFGLIFIYASLAIGVFISSWARTQQVALTAAMAGTLLPSILLSGFVFPIASMPVVLRAITYIVPAKYFLIQARGIMLKGVGFTYLYAPTLFLLVFGTGVLMISVKRFKTNLEG